MASLLLRFYESLDRRGTASERYIKHHVKSRLEKHFGDEKVFCQSSNRSKPEIVYSSAIKVQDVLNAWANNAPALESKSKNQKNSEQTAEDIFRVANYIKKEIKECKGISPRPFDVSDMSVDQKGQKKITGCLYWLIRLLITSRRGASTALVVKICSNATSIPKQWDTYISNCKNKTNLCEFVSNSLC